MEREERDCESLPDSESQDLSLTRQSGDEQSPLVHAARATSLVVQTPLNGSLPSGKKVRSFSAVSAVVRGMSVGVSPETLASVSEKDFDKVNMWKRRLGMNEGSIFTGSLPQLDKAIEEEEDDSDGEMYLDPREIASVIVPAKASRRVSQRMRKRLDTLLSAQASHVYLPVISSEVRAPQPQPQPQSQQPQSQQLQSQQQPPQTSQRVRKEGEVSNHPVIFRSQYKGSSVVMNGTREEDGYATIADRRSFHGKKTAATRKVSLMSGAPGESIYECIEDMGILPPSHSSGALNKTETDTMPHRVPHHLPLTRGSKVMSLDCHRLRRMDMFDGYAYLDTPVSPASLFAEAPPIPPWPSKPRLPPPRKRSAPNPMMHIHPHKQTFSMPVSTLH